MVRLRFPWRGRPATIPPFPAVVVPSPLGQPVPWAKVALATDTGDTHPLNDDRCLVVASRDLDDAAGPSPFRDFLLLLLADGATGSTFAHAHDGPDGSDGGPGDLHEDTRDAHDGAGEREGAAAGWRASQIAQAVFLQAFFASTAPNVIDRLTAALWRADHTLASSPEGRLATTLTALFLGADGTACGAAIGNSALLVMPPKRQTDAARKLRKLGYGDRAAVGNGDTGNGDTGNGDTGNGDTGNGDTGNSDRRSVDGVVESWCPGGAETAGAGSDGRRTGGPGDAGGTGQGGQPHDPVAAGTVFALLSDGIADSLPTDVVDRLTRRHDVERAALEIVKATRNHRLRERRREKASLSEMGLDNMSAILARFDRPPAPPAPPASAPSRPHGRLVWIRGLRGGPVPDAGGPFGLVCLADDRAIPDVLPAFLRGYLESEDVAGQGDRLARAFLSAMGPRLDYPFAAVALDAHRRPAHFAAGGGAVLPLASPSGRGSPAFALGLSTRPPTTARPPALPAGAVTARPTAAGRGRSQRAARRPGVLRAGAAMAAAATLVALAALVLATNTVEVTVGVRLAPWLERLVAPPGEPAPQPTLAPPPESTLVSAPESTLTPTPEAATATTGGTAVAPGVTAGVTAGVTPGAGPTIFPPVALTPTAAAVIPVALRPGG